MELVTILLDEAEETPDWDMRRLREKITQIARWKMEMSVFEEDRFHAICERFHGRMHELMPYS